MLVAGAFQCTIFTWSTLPGIQRTRTYDRDMNDSYAPERRETAVPTFPEYTSRWKLARDLGVFELKLAVDGVKDLILAPLALAAVVADMVGRGNADDTRRRRIGPDRGLLREQDSGPAPRHQGPEAGQAEGMSAYISI